MLPLGHGGQRRDIFLVAHIPQIAGIVDLQRLEHGFGAEFRVGFALVRSGSS